MIKMTKKNLIQGIEVKKFSNYGCSNPLSSTKRKRSTNRIQMKSRKSRQHDEFAALNYYNQISKYDLDRANLCMREAWCAK